MRRTLIAAPIIGAALFLTGIIGIPLLMIMQSIGATTNTTTLTTQPITCDTTLTPHNLIALTTPDQKTNATTIIQTGTRLHIPTQGLIIAIATAMQESGLHNLHYGDRDSVGLFQQRAGWGTTTERENPTTSAELFFHALLQVHGWQDMTVTAAAQAVQRSGFPNAYAKWETLATTTVHQAIGGGIPDCTDTPKDEGLPTGAIGVMLKAALDQQGDPYVWGATGPDAFDCSGLVIYAWRQAGQRLTIRTAAQMWQNSDHIPYGTEQPGDLLFSEISGSHAGHVEIITHSGQVVEAPHTGTVVHTRTYTPNPAYKIGRLHPNVMAKNG